MKGATKRVLPADVYDALEFSALAFGGIGAGKFHDRDDNCAPYCAVGHAAALAGEAYNALGSACIFTHVNDEAVLAINRRRKAEHPWVRVPFDLWCAELGVERGA